MYIDYYHDQMKDSVLAIFSTKKNQFHSIFSRVGLIEWVANTKPLKDFLYGSMTDAEKR